MPKLRKQRRRKVYRHNVNRKRLRNKIYGVGKIRCDEIEKEWDNRKSIKTNLQEMGLSYDPNKTLKIPSMKEVISQNSDSEDSSKEPTKVHVAAKLEAEAKAPRERKFQIPKGQAEFLAYLINKYGKDYKAMARDGKNYEQQTWKQLRGKIKRFRNIPEQFCKYVQETGVLDGESDVSDD